MEVYKMIRIRETALNFFFLSVVLGVLLCSGVVASAGIYYVDINNGEDVDDAGTAAAPWKTLHYSLTQITSGTLNVAAGTYRIGSEVEVGFEPDSPLTISNSDITVIGEGDAAIGASDPTAVIDGTGAGVSAYPWTNGIYITGNNVTIKGLTIRNFTTSGGTGIYIYGGSGNEVLGCKIHNNINGIETSSASNCNVKHCEIYDNTYGLYIYLSTGEIFRNTIHGNNAEDETGIGVFANNCSPEIKRNKIYDNNTGIQVTSNTSTEASPEIANNVIYETIGYTMNYGILVSAFDDPGPGMASPTIYHNSIDGGSGDGIAIENSGGTVQPVIKYNIITRCDVYGIDDGVSVTPANIAYNDAWGNAEENYQNCAAGTGGISLDPENGTAGPLAATSPCKDAIPTTNPPGDPVTMDYLGYKRPKDSGFDMGAYEYIAQQTYTDTLPGGTGALTDYRIFAIPLDVGTGLDMRNTLEATLGTYNPATWRVFARTTSGDIEMNTQAFASLDMKPGMGFWGITVLTNNVSFTGTLTPDAIYYKMELAPGWNLIAVPWPATSIQLGKIYVTDGINQYEITNASNTLTEKYIWDYTGTGSTGYTVRNTSNFALATGTGYYIKVLGSANVILSIPPDNTFDPPGNNAAFTTLAMVYGFPEAVSLTDDPEPPPFPGGPYGPVPNIKANKEGGSLDVSGGTPVSITVSLDPGDQVAKDADWWIVAHTPFAAPLNWYSYVYPEGWRPGIYPCVQTPLFQVPPSCEVLNTILPTGDYKFYFAVDENADGIVDETWVDSVEVRVE
jgi:parallel beta-helix repeat protein